MAKPILVLGGTGNVGAPLVQALLQQGEAVRAASRSGRDIGAAKGIRFDYDDPASLKAAFDDVDRAYLLLPHGMGDVERRMNRLIDAAVAQGGVKIVMQGAMSHQHGPFPYEHCEQHLKQSGAKFVILHPSWFSDSFHAFLSHEIKRGVFALPAKDGLASLIDCRDIAACAATVLTTDAYDGRVFTPTGPTPLSMTQVAAILSEVAGHPVRYENLDEQIFFDRHVAAGMPHVVTELFLEAVRGVAAGRVEAVNGDVRLLTGQDPRPFRDYADRHIADFRAD